MPARNPGESESSGGGEPRPYSEDSMFFLSLKSSVASVISVAKLVLKFLAF